jgi:hypothetical protein
MVSPDSRAHLAYSTTLVCFYIYYLPFHPPLVLCRVKYLVKISRSVVKISWSHGHYHLGRLGNLLSNRTHLEMRIAGSES